jgi:electron transfer flavoprotein beta subunit
VNIIVCLKQVPDPDAPANQFTLDAAARKVIPDATVNPVVSPFDQNAIEAALQIKEASGGGKVTALSLGLPFPLEALKRALHMGVDDAVLVDDGGISGPQPQATGYILAKAIQKIGNFDLVLCGRQAADWDQGQVGCIIAEVLNIPCVTIVSRIEIKDGALRVRRLVEDGYEVMELPLPALVTVTNEINQPRLPKVALIIRASSKTIPVWSRQEIGIDPSIFEALRSPRLEILYIPEFKGDCQIVAGETSEEMAANLVTALRVNKVI